MKWSCYLTGKRQTKDTRDVFSLLARWLKCCASLDSEKVCVQGGGGPARASFFLSNRQQFSPSFSLFIFVSSLQLKNHLLPDTSLDSPLLFQLCSCRDLTMLHITSCQSWFICCGQNTSRSEQLEISESRVFLKPKPFGKWPKCEPSFSPMFPFLGLKTNQADKQTFNPVFFLTFARV